MALSTQQSEGLLLKAAIQTYVLKRQPTTHMRGFFSKKTYDSTTIPLEVLRYGDKAAVDVVRGTNGNKNQAGKWSSTEILPPMYHENFDINSLRNYERAFGQMASIATASNRASLANEVAENLLQLQNKIVRAEEIQCVQALETGIVTLVNGDAINFGRSADSLVDNSSTPWTNVAADIEAQIEAAGRYIANEGGNTASTLDLTMSGQAWIALKNSNFFKNTANYQKVTLIAIGNPQNRNGATYHGQLTAGSFVCNIWVYDATYTNVAGSRVRLTDDTKVIVTPAEGGQFELSYGAVDTIVKSSGASSVSGVQLEKGMADYYVWDNLDTNNLVHTMHMTSAPVARLVTVDMVYTMKIAVDFTSVIQG